MCVVEGAVLQSVVCHVDTAAAADGAAAGVGAAGATQTFPQRSRERERERERRTVSSREAVLHGQLRPTAKANIFTSSANTNTDCV